MALLLLFALSVEIPNTTVRAQDNSWICVAGYTYDFISYTFRALGATRSSAATKALAKCESQRIPSYMSSPCRLHSCKRQ
jgi:hypothetical protein